jgi:polar amino acid transport system ATP-binding protein
MTNMIDIINVKKSFGDNHVLRDVSLSVRKGEVLVILGPSGSGKSTLIRCINRLESIDGGTIMVEGEDIYCPTSDIHKLRTKVGMVFQQFNLFPHMTVLDTLTLAPQGQGGVQGSERAHGARPPGEGRPQGPAGAYPHELSGDSSSAWPLHARWQCIPISCSLTR